MNDNDCKLAYDIAIEQAWSAYVTQVNACNGNIDCKQSAIDSLLQNVTNAQDQLINCLLGNLEE